MTAFLHVQLLHSLLLCAARKGERKLLSYHIVTSILAGVHPALGAFQRPPQCKEHDGLDGESARSCSVTSAIAEARLFSFSNQEDWWVTLG